MPRRNANTLPYRRQVKEFMEIARVRAGFSWVEYADATNQTRQNVYNKLNAGTITLAELFLFADKMGFEVKLVDKISGKPLA